MRNNKFIKTAIKVIIVVILAYLLYDNYYLIVNKLELIYTKYFEPDNTQVLIDNEYKKEVNYDYVKINKDTNIKNKDMLKNAVYTFLDAGWESYIISCDPSYTSCITDAKEIVQNNSYLTDLSNFVHPFNTFEKINTTFTSSGKITLTRKARYTDNQIKEINNKVNSIYDENYDESKSIEENIKIFHDYIINNTRYDTNNTSGDASINSSTAYGVLIEGNGICSGYTDAMALFLEKMGLKNYRISSISHVWNIVYVNEKWLHIDLTWDDPVVSDGSDMLSDKYLLITTEELNSRNDGEHDFNREIYIEAK